MEEVTSPVKKVKIIVKKKSTKPKEVKTFTKQAGIELRHNIYAWLIMNGYCETKEQAKILLKKFGYFPRKRKNNKRKEKR